MSSTTAEDILRVERGHARSEELAAITVVLLARAAARSGAAGGGPGEEPRKAGWRRLERSRGFQPPHSWRG
ncbi:acyl-CoA carboxylase subunit epsilon [Streptomyces sp. SID13666]|uniref:acyl-CoA carboxylase subunit epsilon n=1 Tax=unclassified Streptomyces TaxID=2593676 RepID=UPI0013BF866C|nr:MULTISPECIES: acyl-CoA carboxylase subunit epsilon [unclassified Streptomyces]NEA55093.1 acyl-CoA carboxylase subunit epsilon [Streptomyces sp. SID13666]NEA71100.1 acyl-CoA carboxylase subunit epsilon [Streptomyces sp. SID13588]